MTKRSFYIHCIDIMSRRLYHAGDSNDIHEECRQHCYDCLLVELKRLLHTELSGLGAGVSVALLATAVNNAGISSRVAADTTAIELAVRLITRATSKSDDEIFHRKLYDYLYSDHKDLLVSITSKFIEKYLMEKDQVGTELYKYYNLHNMHSKAVQLKRECAEYDGDCPLADRIENLIDAVTSARRAVIIAGERNVDSESVESEMLRRVEDLLEIAELQQLVLSELIMLLDEYSSGGELNDGQNQSKRWLEDDIKNIENKLIVTDDLFNLAQKYNLWGLCLQIFQVCKFDNMDWIQKLWLSEIYKIVPNSSSDHNVQRKLEMKYRNSLLRSDNGLFFEVDCKSWKNMLVNRIVNLGGKLRAPILHNSAGNNSVWEGFSPVLPLIFLVEELEDLASIISYSLRPDRSERAWVANCFRKTGYSHYSLIEAYIEVIERLAQGKHEEIRLHLLWSVSYLIKEWTALGRGFNASQTNEVRQLISVAKSGKLKTWLDSIKSRSDGLPITSDKNIKDEIMCDIEEAEYRRSILLMDA